MDANREEAMRAVLFSRVCRKIIILADGGGILK